MMRSGAAAVLGIGLAQLLWGSAAADEAWTCHYTESRYRLGAREIVQPGIGTFILRLTSKLVSMVVIGTGGETVNTVSYSLVENSPARLVAEGRFDRQPRPAVTVTVRLDKKSGSFIQTGSDHRQTNSAHCSRRVIAVLRAKPSGGGAHPGSGSRLEAPLPRRRIFTGKRGA